MYRMMAKIPFSNEHHIINLAQAGQGTLFFLVFSKKIGLTNPSLERNDLALDWGRGETKRRGGRGARALPKFVLLLLSEFLNLPLWQKFFPVSPRIVSSGTLDLQLIYWCDWPTSVR